MNNKGSVSIIILIIAALALGGTAYFSQDQGPVQDPVVGAFGSPFKSIQLATSPGAGECLTTDGTDNDWAACGSGGGGSINTLGEIGDVNTTTIATWDTLYYDGSEWVVTATTSWDTDTDTTCDSASCNVTNTGTLDGYEASALLDDTVRATTSLDYWESTKWRWATSSVDYWETTQAARGGGSGSSAWELFAANAITPTSTSNGIFVQASSTFTNSLTVSDGGNNTFGNSGGNFNIFNSHLSVASSTPWNGYGLVVATTSVFTQNILLYEQTTDPSIDFMTPGVQTSFYLDNDDNDEFKLWRGSDILTFGTTSATTTIHWTYTGLEGSGSDLKIDSNGMIYRGSDATGATAGAAWEYYAENAITPTTTGAGLFVTASSTFTGGLNVIGSGDIYMGTGSNNIFASSTLQVDDAATFYSTITTQAATTTNLGVSSLAVASCDVKATTDGSLYCGTDASGSGGSAAWEEYSTGIITPTTSGAGIRVATTTIYHSNPYLLFQDPTTNNSGTTTLAFNHDDADPIKTAIFSKATGSWNRASLYFALRDEESNSNSVQLHDTVLYVGWNGLVGINTINPTYNFQVNGNSYFGGSATTSNFLHIGTGGTINYLSYSNGDLYVQDDVEIDGNLYVSGITSLQAATTTNLAVSTLTDCDTIDTDSNGTFICGTDATGAGGGAFAWTDLGDPFGVSTSTPITIDARATTTGITIISDTSSSSAPYLFNVVGGSDDATAYFYNNGANAKTKVTIKGGMGNLDGAGGTQAVFEILQGSNGNQTAWIRDDGVLGIAQFNTIDDSSFAAIDSSKANGNNPKGANIGYQGNIGWSSTSNFYDAKDVNISRISAGLLGVGTGAQGSFAGDLKFASATSTGSFDAAQFLQSNVPLSSIYVADGCTDCLNATEIEDIYLLDGESDTMTGTLTADGLTLGANENITLGSETLNHDGTAFTFSDSVDITGNSTSTGHFTITNGTNGITIEPGATTTFSGF